MASITLLPAPEYTDDEREALIDFVLALKKTSRGPKSQMKCNTLRKKNLK